jgi:hypothetical protein
MLSTIRRLGALAASLALLGLGVSGPATADSTCNAANECGIYQLADIKEYWGGQIPPDSPVVIDKTEYSAFGGFIEFRVKTTSTAPECYAHVQHFKFSWRFVPDVNRLAGKSGATLALMPVQWEGDSGDACVDENPFVWIRSGGRYGPNEVNQVTGDTFKLSFANQGGENRIYFDGSGSSAPTIGMNGPLYATGGFEIMPSIRGLGNPFSIVYAYVRVPDEQPPVAQDSPTIRVSAVDNRSGLRVDVDPNRGAGFWTFEVQRRNPDGTWSVVGTYRTRGSGETRTIDLAKGTYRVVTQPKYGYAAATSGQVRLAR